MAASFVVPPALLELRPSLSPLVALLNQRMVVLLQPELVQAQFHIVYKNERLPDFAGRN